MRLLTSVLFEFISTNALGKEEVDYTVELTNATISGFKGSVHLGEKAGPIVDSRELEVIKLVFQKITVTSVTGGTSSRRTIGRCRCSIEGFPYSPPVAYFTLHPYGRRGCGCDRFTGHGFGERFGDIILRGANVFCDRGSRDRRSRPGRSACPKDR